MRRTKPLVDPLAGKRKKGRTGTLRKQELDAAIRKREEDEFFESIKEVQRETAEIPIGKFLCGIDLMPYIRICMTERRECIFATKQDVRQIKSRIRPHQMVYS